MSTRAVPRQLGRFLPAIVPAVVAIVPWWLGHPARALTLCAVAVVVAVLIVCGVPVERYVGRIAHAIADAVGWVLSMIVGVVLVVVGGILRLVGVDPLTPRSMRSAAWVPVPTAEQMDRLSTSPFGYERPELADTSTSTFRAVGRAGLSAVGIVTLLLVVDAGVGSVWQALGPEDPPVAVADGVNFTGATATTHDVRADGVAMSAYPWADAYFRELQSIPYSYWPFTESRPESFDGKYVHLDGWERRTYRSPDAGADAPVVWMFGGSTAFGEGQRDEYTIASQVVRQSEASGDPIVVRNFGQRGWTHFQEMVLFEQLLASEERPDVVVFYDGANEINAQSLSVKGVPTHVQVDQYAALVSGGIPEEFRTKDPEPSPISSLWDAYLRHSALRQTVGWFRDTIDPPAGAAEPNGDEPAGEADGQLSYEQRTPEDARRAVEVYERGRDLSNFLAERAGVEPLFLWQPVVADEPDLVARSLLTAPTIDLSDALTGQEGVYIDGGRTNEAGARIVAERIWALLEPRL